MSKMKLFWYQVWGGMGPSACYVYFFLAVCLDLFLFPRYRTSEYIPLYSLHLPEKEPRNNNQLHIGVSYKKVKKVTVTEGPSPCLRFAWRDGGRKSKSLKARRGRKIGPQVGWGDSDKGIKDRPSPSYS